MKLQHKLFFIMLPLMVLPIVLLGIWSARESISSVRQSTALYMQAELDAYVRDNLESRVALLKESGLDTIASFVTQFQQEAIAAAALICQREIGHLVIIDSKGHSVYCEEGNLMKDLPTDEIFRIIHEKGKDSREIRYFSEGGSSDNVYIATYFEPWDWVVIFVYESKILHQAERNIYRGTVGITAIFTLLSFLAITLLSKSFFIDPIKKLTKASLSIEKNEKLSGIDVHSNDELGLLARRMEAMASAIEHHQAQQENWGRELEQKVEQRTEELLVEIREREKTQLFLSQSEELFRTAFETSPDYVSITKMDGTYVDVNERFVGDSGVAKESLIGRSSLDLHIWDNPADRARLVDELRRTGFVDNFEAVFHSKKGAITGLMSARVISIKNEPHILSITRDITAQRIAEAERIAQAKRTQKYLDIAGVMLCTLDRSGRVTMINQKGAEILGYAQHEIIGKDWFEHYLPQRMKEPVRKVFALLMEGQEKPVEYYENPVLTGDGTEKLIAFHNKLLTDAEGNIRGCLYSGEDITQRRMIEDGIARSLREKEVLLKEVHHRVKNNMAVVSSLLGLQAGYVDEKDAKYREMFEESQGRIRSMALVHEQLYQSEDFAHIDVRDYLQSVTQNIYYSCTSGKAVKERFDVDDLEIDIDVLVPCGLIINEILTNAFKHAFHESDHPEIAIALKRHEQNHVRLSVSDNGCGFPEGFTITRSKGLGLKLVQILSRQINGTLEVHSGQGVTFTITFPMRMAQAKHPVDHHA